MGWGHLVVAVSPATAIQGEIDLRNWDPDSGVQVALGGEWRFFWEEFRDQSHLEGAGVMIDVPGTWRGLTVGEEQLPGQGFGTYTLRILLPNTLTGLGLSIPEFRTAYELEVNGQLMCGNGIIGQTKETTQPQFTPHIIRLPDSTGQVDVILRGANFHFFTGGMQQVLILDRYENLENQQSEATLWCGILFGMLLLAALFHLILFAYRPKDLFNLFFSGACLLWAFITLLINMRFMFQWLGPEAWVVNTKAEVVLAMLAFLSMLFFFYHFYKGVVKRLFYIVMISMLSCLILFICFAPVSISTGVERIAPLVLSILIVAIFWIALKAQKAGKEGAFFFLIVGVLVVFLGILDVRSPNGLHPGAGLMHVHFGIVGFVMTVSILIARRSGRSFSKVVVLSRDLQQANVSLEEQNESLEVTVRERTERLVATEKKNHDLEIRQKQRDLENLSASNRMVQQHNQTLIEELKGMLEGKGNLSQEIKVLIRTLQDQGNTAEKVLKLQEQVETINEAFNQRLRTEYPSLSKGERELCAYIKLSLSNKDIAALRNTTLNTINVARHRLRKKFKLERGDELETFIQQI